MKSTGEYWKTQARRDRQLRAWRLAAEHLIAVQTPPLVSIKVSRQLWRAGDKQLAERLAAWAGACD
jgi:hypothetical protein